MSRRMRGALIASIVVAGIVGGRLHVQWRRGEPIRRGGSEGAATLNVTLTEFQITRA